MKTMRSLLAALAFVIPLRAQVPQLVNYQGRVAVGTVNFNGSGAFKFALVNAAGTTAFWSNDGTLPLTPGALTPASQPTAAVALPVAKSLYSVLLGDISLYCRPVAPTTGVPVDGATGQRYFK